MKVREAAAPVEGGPIGALGWLGKQAASGLCF